MKILYVEDDLEVRTSTVELLKPLFSSVTVAEDGEEALNIFHNSRFDIVLSDIVMPKMDGIELVKEIKRSDESQAIVMLSAYNESPYLLDLINLGVSRFVMKPIRIKDFLGILLEITTNVYNAKQVLEKKEQEKILQRQVKLVQMGELVSMIAHQWRQPLNALGLILQKMKLFNDRGRLTTEMIDTNVEHSMGIISDMSKTIDDFRDIVKNDSEKNLFNLISVIRKVESIMKEYLSSKNIELVHNIDPALQIESYQNELFHILINLVSNATDAYEGKEIDQKTILIKAAKHENSLELVVEDNAGGIPEEIMDQVFNPYFTTKEQGKGTGLGLWMSKEMVESIFNGTMKVHNDKGAVFTINFEL